jgi:hypothetical protein
MDYFEQLEFDESMPTETREQFAILAASILGAEQCIALTLTKAEADTLNKFPLNVDWQEQTRFFVVFPTNRKAYDAFVRYEDAIGDLGVFSGGEAALTEYQDKFHVLLKKKARTLAQFACQQARVQ